MPSFTAQLDTGVTYIAASPESPKEVFNNGAGIVYHKNESDVDSGDTELASGSSVQITEGKYFTSASSSEIQVRELQTSTKEDFTSVDDMTVGDDLTVEGKQTVAETLAVTGVTTPTGGVASTGTLPGVWAGGWNPVTAESGTDVELAEKKLFLTGLWLPANKTLTGIGILVGTVGEKGKIVVGLFDAEGNVLAKSSEAEEGTAVGAAKEVQEVPFTSEYEAIGPRLYYVGVTGNNAEDDLQTIPANTAGNNIFAGEKELAEKNTLATVAEPPTTFTGGKGPIAFVY